MDNPEHAAGQHPPAHPVRRHLPWRHWAVAAAAILAATLAWRFTPLAQVVTPQNVIAWTHRLAEHWWAPLVLMLAYTPASVVMFPRPLITLALVVAFGPWHGFAYSMTGILLAALAAYAVGRMMDAGRVRRMTGDRLYRLAGVLRERGLVTMTALRLVPLAPFAVESMFAGAVRIRVWHYLAGTFLGLSPGVLTATVFGDQLEAAVNDPSRLNYPLIAAVLLILLAGTFAVRRWFARLEREHCD
jgi:phospholipase D1/2